MILTPLASAITQYTEGDTDASITGVALMWEDTGNTLRAPSAAKPLPVEIISGGGGGGPTSDVNLHDADGNDIASTIYNDIGSRGVRSIPISCYTDYAVSRVVGVGSTVSIIVVDDSSGVVVGDIWQSNNDPDIVEQWRYITNVSGNNITLEYPLPEAPTNGSLWNSYKPFFLYASSDSASKPVLITAPGNGSVWPVSIAAPVSITGGPISVTEGSDWDVNLWTGNGIDQINFGQAAMASSLPVVLASNQSAIPITDNSGSLTVDNGGTFAVQDSQVIADNAAFTDTTSKVFLSGYIFDDVAGTALTENDAAAARIDSKRAQMFVLEDATTRGQKATVSAAGALKVDGSAVTQPISGTITANAGSGTFTISGAVTNIGTFAVQESGAALTALQLIDNLVTNEDTASANLDSGVVAFARRTASPANTSGTDGDYEAFQISAGRLWVSATIDAALPAGSNVIGAVTQSGTWNVGTVTTITNVVHVDDNSSTLSIDDGAGSITVDGTVAVSGTVTIAGAVTNAGTFAVQVDGAALTALQLIDNLPNTLGSTTSGQSGALALGAVTTAAPSYTTAQSNALSLTTVGNLRVDGSSVTQPVSGTVTANAGSGTFTISGAVTNAGTFAVQPAGSVAHDAPGTGVNPVLIGGYASAAAPTDVSTDGDSVRAWYLKNGAQATVLTAAGALISGDAANGLDVDVTRMSALVAGSALIGKVGIDQTTVGTTNAVSIAQLGANTIATGNGASSTGVLRVAQVNDGTGVLATVTNVTTVATVTNVATIGTSVTPGTGAANLGKAEDAVASSGDTGVAVLHVVNNTNATKAADGDYTFASTDASGMMRMVGNVASDAADAGDPIKIGGQARQTNPTAVADADRVNFIADDLGRQVVVCGQVRDLITDQTTTITSSTSETTILAAVASTFLDITQLILANSSNASVVVTIKQSTAGTTRMKIPLAAKGGAVINFARPMTQGAVNNNWTATCDVSVASVEIYVQAEKNI